MLTRDSLKKIGPIAVALVFFAVAVSRPEQRGVWLGIGVVFLIIGLRRRRPRSGPGA